MARTITLLMLCVTIGLTVTQNPGVKIRVTAKGVDYGIAIFTYIFLVTHIQRPSIVPPIIFPSSPPPHVLCLHHFLPKASLYVTPSHSPITFDPGLH